jgi:PBSX family phage terminase large subunit
MTKEYYYSGREEGKQKDNELYYETLDKFIGDKRILGIIIDPSATSFIQTIKKYKKFKVIKAKNDVKEGIENTGTALNTNKILIDKSCKNMIREFYSYMWDEKAAERGEEQPIKQNDHCCDSLRYMVNTVIGKKKSMFEDKAA